VDEEIHLTAGIFSADVATERLDADDPQEVRADAFAAVVYVYVADDLDLVSRNYFFSSSLTEGQIKLVANIFAS
jgi:hypothetical protein